MDVDSSAVVSLRPRAAAACSHVGVSVIIASPHEPEERRKKPGADPR